MRAPLLLVALMACLTAACAAPPANDLLPDETGEDVGEDEAAVKKKKKGDGKKDDDKKPEDKPATVRFEVLQHNIGAGTAGENGTGPEALAYTFKQIDERKPDVVMLEEVCWSQVAIIKAKYPGWNVYFSQMSAAHPGCGGPKGQVLATDRAMSNVWTEDLGDVDPHLEKHFTLLCGDVAKAGKKVLACVTHLRAGGYGEPGSEALAARGRQIQNIKGHLRDYVQAGRAVVFAGDFNTRPHEPLFDPIHRLTRSGEANGGPFDEADQTDDRRERFAEKADERVKCAQNACRSGEPTVGGHKIDHIFFSHNRVAGQLSAEVLENGGSAHKLYYGSAELDL